MSSDQLPSRNVAFFFSDIEGSTELWERHPEGMRTALARHDELLRTAINSHNGRIFKSTGRRDVLWLGSLLDFANKIPPFFFAFLTLQKGEILLRFVAANSIYPVGLQIN